MVNLIPSIPASTPRATAARNISLEETWLEPLSRNYVSCCLDYATDMDFAAAIVRREALQDMVDKEHQRVPSRNATPPAPPPPTPNFSEVDIITERTSCDARTSRPNSYLARPLVMGPLETLPKILAFQIAPPRPMSKDGRVLSRFWEHLEEEEAEEEKSSEEDSRVDSKEALQSSSPTIPERRDGKPRGSDASCGAFKALCKNVCCCLSRS